MRVIPFLSFLSLDLICVDFASRTVLGGLHSNYAVFAWFLFRTVASFRDRPRLDTLPSAARRPPVPLCRPSFKRRSFFVSLFRPVFRRRGRSGVFAEPRVPRDFMEMARGLSAAGFLDTNFPCSTDEDGSVLLELLIGGIGRLVFWFTLAARLHRWIASGLPGKFVKGKLKVERF